MIFLITLLLLSTASLNADWRNIPRASDSNEIKEKYVNEHVEATKKFYEEIKRERDEREKAARIELNEKIAEIKALCSRTQNSTSNLPAPVPSPTNNTSVSTASKPSFNLSFEFPNIVFPNITFPNLEKLQKGLLFTGGVGIAMAKSNMKCNV